MHENDRKYKDGETIFREGDASHCAYVLISGNVDLTKKTAKGDLALASMDPGEMFGEMGVFDLSARSATARARGEVLVRTIARDDFIDSLTTKPEAAFAVIGKLVKRLRAADDRLAKAMGSSGEAFVSGSAPALSATSVSASAPSKQTFLQRLLRLRQKEPKPKRLEVRIAGLEGDTDGSQRKRLIAALSKRKEIHVRSLPETLVAGADPETLPVRLGEIATAARAWLQKADADILIWGAIPPPGPTIQLRFVPVEAEDEDRPGAFALLTRLNLPVDFPPELADVVYAVTLAASGDASPLGRDKPEPMLVAALPKAIQAVLPMIQEMPAEMTPLERSGVTLSLANAAAGAAAAGTPDLYQVAAHGYRKSLHLMKRVDSPYDCALCQRNLGMVLQALGERLDDAKFFEEAAACYTSALEVFIKTNFPLLWATAQNRLGECYYRQDLDSGDTELVKSALVAFQSAAMVVTRNERGPLWAKIMNNFAQAALVLGELLPSREALERAVTAAKGALEVRMGDANPLPWATTQNTLGLALFLLGKQTRDRILLPPRPSPPCARSRTSTAIRAPHGWLAWLKRIWRGQKICWKRSRPAACRACAGNPTTSDVDAGKEAAMAKAATKERPTKTDDDAPALAVSGIDHVVLHVTDLARSRRFYTEVLGMTVKHDYPRHLFLGCGGQRAALFVTDDKDGFEAGRDLNHLALNVAGKSYEEIVAALRSRGIKVEGRTGDDRCIYFEDPDGHQLQIVAGSVSTVR